MGRSITQKANDSKHESSPNRNHMVKIQYLVIMDTQNATTDKFI